MAGTDSITQETDDEIPEGYTLIRKAEPAEDVPEGYVPIPKAAPTEPEKPGIVSRVVRRFLGTDVDDPAEWPRLGATVAGGFGGGVLGSRLPVAPGPAGVVINPVTGAVAGGLVGAVGGAVAPEATMGAAALVGLIDEETRKRYSLSFEDLRTLAEGEALLELATGGTLLALRLGGRLTTRALAGSGDEPLTGRFARTRTAFRGVGRAFTGGGEGAEVAAAAHRQGIELMPVQVGGRAIGRGYVAVMGRFPFLHTPLSKRGQAAEDALRIRLQSAPERIGPISNWSDVSERIFDDARDLAGRTSKYFDEKYTAL